MARATSSLPVPDSPRISTVASVGATRPMALYTSCMGLLLPMMASAAAVSGATSSSTRERMNRPASRAWPIKARMSGNLKGLEHVFEGPQLGGLDGRLRGAEGGHDDDRQLGLNLVHGPEGLQAAHPRHAHIHDHQVRDCRLDQTPGRLAGGRGPHGVAFRGQELFKALPELRVVVDN